MIFPLGFLEASVSTGCRALDGIPWIVGSTIHPVCYQVEINRLNEILNERSPMFDRVRQVTENALETGRVWAVPILDNIKIKLNAWK